MDDAIKSQLERRLGRLHVRQRLGIEMDHEAQIFGQGINFFHIENWYSIHSFIYTVMRYSRWSASPMKTIWMRPILHRR